MIEPFVAANGALVQLLTGAVATTPGLSRDDANQRAQIAIGCLMGFLPLNPVMTMLASQAVGHHFLMLDTLKETTDRPGIDAASERLRKLGIAETRVMLSLMKELRIARKEHIAMVEAERDGSLPVPPKAAATLAPVQRVPAEDPAIEKPAESDRDSREELVTADGAGETARTVPAKPTPGGTVVRSDRIEPGPADRTRAREPVPG